MWGKKRGKQQSILHPPQPVLCPRPVWKTIIRNIFLTSSSPGWPTHSTPPLIHPLFCFTFVSPAHLPWFLILSCSSYTHKNARRHSAFLIFHLIWSGLVSSLSIDCTGSWLHIWWCPPLFAALVSFPLSIPSPPPYMHLFSSFQADRYLLNFI